MGMISTNMTVSGYEELARKFNELPQKIEVKYMREAVNGGAEKMVSDLQARCYIAPVHRKGVSKSATRKHGAYSQLFLQDLHDSITKNNARKLSNRIASQITANYYAKFQEFGSYGHKGYHPFVRPTMDADADRVVQEMLEALKSNIMGI